MLDELRTRYPGLVFGRVNAKDKRPDYPHDTWKGREDGKDKLKAHQRWGVIPITMGFVVFDVDRDHELAHQELLAAFGEPSAKVKSRQQGFHYWYPAEGTIPNGAWLFGDIRGSNGYIILWDLPSLIEQLDGNGSLNVLTRDSIMDPLSGRLATRPQTKIDTMLEHVDPDNYDIWLKVGMALQAEMGESGLPAWEKWSRRSPKFQEGLCADKWQGFADDKGGVTIGTLYHYAREGGYKPAGGRPSAPGGVAPAFDKAVRVGAGSEMTWELTAGESKVTITQSELCNQARFRTAWHAATGVVVRMKRAEWDKFITDLWGRAEVRAAPNLDSIIWSMLDDFCTDSYAMDTEELLNGLPYTEDGVTWFRVTDLHGYLLTKRISAPIQRVWSAIRAHVEPMEKTVDVKGKRIRVCGVPAFAQQSQEFSVPKSVGLLARWPTRYTSDSLLVYGLTLLMCVVSSNWLAGMSRLLLKFVQQALLVEQATQPWPSVQGRG